MILGVDFGTTNSTAAVRLPDGRVEPVVLDPGSAAELLLPSCWFFPEERQEAVIGSRAKAEFAASMFEGRFISSLKRYLGDEKLRTIKVKSRLVPVENIVSLLLEQIRVAAEDQFGEITEVVAGRPVVISATEKENQLMEDRLREAYRIAGFPEPRFVPEPVAAAFKYKHSLTAPETVFVADFGGGTLDYCLAVLQPGGVHGRDEIVGVKGVRLGGDDMTAILTELFWDFFGRSCEVMNFARTQYIPYNSGVYRKLGDWRNIWELHNLVDEIEATISWGCTDEEALRRLIALLETHVHYAFLNQLEDVKIDLSTAEEHHFLLREPPIDLDMDIPRHTYEGLTGDLMATARQVLRETFAGTGLSPEDVQAVFFTGGSSQIPVFRQTVLEFFPHARIQDKDAFTSVSLGLAQAGA